MLRAVVTMVFSLVLTSCTSPSRPAPATDPSTAGPSTAASSTAPATTARVPDLIGLTSLEATRLLGELQESTAVDVSTNWARPVAVRCGVRPGTVVRQHPAPGVRLTDHRSQLTIRTGALDLERFRGPCEPAEGDLGPVTGPDAAVARQFYRYSADPRLGAPFASGETWVGIERGPTSALLDAVERRSLSAWEVGTAYAERSGPFSALDIVASSGGVYELHAGFAPTCGMGKAEAPQQLRGLRAISLTVPADAASSCMEWWAVTLFLDDDDRIAGVALRLGSP